MENNVREALQNAGVNMERTLERFMNNEELFLKFIRRFPQDQNYQMLERAAAENNWENMERTAHTLKGISGNLGLDPLATALTSLIALLRTGETEGLEYEFAQVKKQYDVFYKIITQLFE